ncbi:MAG: PilZ domain-containing protein [Desulfovibrio sp.]|jgi:hypothetical protein|nr:PilZ domain-containing protein [Desulfovibrio sp.]
MERRSLLRVPLEVPFFVIVCLHDGYRCTAILADCGRGGVQLAFSPSLEDKLATLLGQELILLDLPEGLRTDPDGCSGVVTWVSPQRCGVRFNQVLSLTDEELTRVASSL